MFNANNEFYRRPTDLKTYPPYRMQEEVDRLYPDMQRFKREIERRAQWINMSAEDLIDGAIRSALLGYRCVCRKQLDSAACVTFDWVSEVWELLIPADASPFSPERLDLDWGLPQPERKPWGRSQPPFRDHAAERKQRQLEMVEGPCRI